VISEPAGLALQALEHSPALMAQFKAVAKALAFLQHYGPSYKGLHSKLYASRQGPNKEKIFQSYAQNKTPGAYRIYWYYGPEQKMLTVVDITAHP
jgi:hypothetical protein